LLKAVETRLKKTELLRETFAHDAENLKDLIDKTEKAGGMQLTSELRDVHHYKKKQYLYSEGNHPHYVYYVVKGKVKSYLINDDGKELITAIYTEGDFIGYTSVLENKPHKDNAETLEESELMVIPAEDFMSLLHSDPLVSRQFIKLLTKNVIETEEKLMSIAYNSLRKRIASALIELQEKFRTDPNEPARIEISRENLARVVGTAKESLIRTLSDFKQEKLIDIVDGKILVLDEKKLQSLPY
jgi:CRP-like cAMP-binding protein